MVHKNGSTSGAYSLNSSLIQVNVVLCLIPIKYGNYIID